MPLSAGQIINNRYRIVSLLGQGGFGAVYKAWDINMERARAMKENLDTTPEAQRQFKREAQILGDLSHPNLPRVIDHFIIPGQGQYLVMDLVEGEDLQEMLLRVGSPLPEVQVLQWIGQVCQALKYLHSLNPPVIHRDIKPANIKIASDGKAILVDFGIVKIYDPNLRTTLGARAVTSGYSPPEQYGRGATDAQSDVYALGATLYTLLTGQEPPESIDILAKNSPPPLPAILINSAVSPRVSKAIERAMQLEKGSRFGSVAEFMAALQSNTILRVERNTVRYPLNASAAQPAKTLNRIVPLSWVFAGIVICLVVVIIFSLILGERNNKILPTISQAIVILHTDPPPPTFSKIPDTVTPKPKTATLTLMSILTRKCTTISRQHCASDSRQRCTTLWTDANCKSAASKLNVKEFNQFICTSSNKFLRPRAR